MLQFQDWKSKDDERAFTAEIVDIVRDARLQDVKMKTVLATDITADDAAKLYTDVARIGAATDIDISTHKERASDLAGFVAELEAERARPLMSTGNLEFDRILLGGFERNSMWMFTGQQGDGKSFALSTIAAECVWHGRNILVVTLEISRMAWENRYWSCLLQVPNVIVPRHAPDLYASLRPPGTLGNATFCYVPPGATPITDVDALIRQHIEVNGRYDAIFIDYLDLLLPPKSLPKSTPRHDAIRVLYEFARDWCIPDGADLCDNVFTVSQIRRPTKGDHKKGNHDQNDAADSQGKIRTVDGAIGILASPDEREIGMYRLKILKRRNREFSGEELVMDSSIKGTSSMWPLAR